MLNFFISRQFLPFTVIPHCHCFQSNLEVHKITYTLNMVIQCTEELKWENQADSFAKPNSGKCVKGLIESSHFKVPSLRFVVSLGVLWLIISHLWVYNIKILIKLTFYSPKVCLVIKTVSNLVYQLYRVIKADGWWVIMRRRNCQ